MLLIKLGLTALEIRVFSFCSVYKHQMLMVMAKSCPGGSERTFLCLLHPHPSATAVTRSRLGLPEDAQL